MLKARVAKIVSARKLWLLTLIAAVIVATGVWLWQRTDELVQFGSARVSLERADTNESRTRGLSGRESLPDDAGLLFVFDGVGEHCMWMKDMNFSIDIVWLDEAKRVVDIQERVAPETYPESFCSEVPAKFAIEVNAGVVARAGLRRDDSITF